MIINKNRKIKISVRTVICTIIMAALILTGAAPSFAVTQSADLSRQLLTADGETADTNSQAGSGAGGISLKASADINWDDAPEIAGTSAIMIDAGSGAVLYEKNAYEQLDPASMTKIITALIALETLDMNEKITAANDADQSGININLKAGEVLTAEQLINAMLIYSANDAADALAVHMGGSWEGFAEMMNERAAQCGAKNTEFSNPNGLTPEGARHVTTAYDMAMIAREAMKNEQFREIVAKKQYTIPATNMSAERTVKSTNLCIAGGSRTAVVNGTERTLQYKGATGIKTGYTEYAGYCFCGSAKRDDTELIAVTMNASEKMQRFTDVIALWDYGFSKYYTYKAAESDEVLDELRVWQGQKSHVAAGIAEDMDITLNKETKKSTVTTEVVKPAQRLKAPIKAGDTVGTLVAYDENHELIASADLIALENVEEGGPLSYIGIADEEVPAFIAFLAGLILLIIVISVLVRSSRRRKKKQKNRGPRKNGVNADRKNSRRGSSDKLNSRSAGSSGRQNGRGSCSGSRQSSRNSASKQAKRRSSGHRR